MNITELEATAESISNRLASNPDFQFGVRNAMTGIKEEIVSEVSETVPNAVRDALDDQLAKFVSEAVVKRLSGVDASQLRIAMAGVLHVCLTVPPTERSPRALHAAIGEIVARCHRAGVTAD
jgi:hypothetical protein